jgi:NitT/TauT family transport system substrate-binding protein
VEFKSGGEAISAQQSGSVDIVLSIPGTAMSAIERGFDLVAIMQNEIAHDKGPDSGSLQVLATSDLKSLADLKGKKVAVSALRTQQAVATQLVLKRAGLEPKDVQFVEVPYPSQTDALRSKQVDAASPVDPFTTQMIASGVGRVISWVYVEATPLMPLGAWFTKTATIKRNPQAIAAFTQSIKESIDYLNADENRGRDKVVAYTGLKPELVRDMPPVAWDYRVRPDKWQAVSDMMQESGELDKKHKAEDFFSEQIKAYVVK